MSLQASTVLGDPRPGPPWLPPPWPWVSSTLCCQLHTRECQHPARPGEASLLARVRDGRGMRWRRGRRKAHPAPAPLRQGLHNPGVRLNCRATSWVRGQVPPTFFTIGICGISTFCEH